MSIPQKVPTFDEVIESVIIQGDLSRLTSEQRVAYYNKVCTSIGLNPITQPFEYITLQGKLKLYARRDAADQLRKINRITIEIVSQEQADGLLMIHVRAKDRDGRQDEDLGVVTFTYPERFRDRDGVWKSHPKAGKPLEGEDRANQILKCVTKAKRRVTLSISGLGFFDEIEIDDMPAAVMPPKAAPNVLLHDPEPLPAQNQRHLQGDKGPPLHDPETGEIQESVATDHTGVATDAAPEDARPPARTAGAAPSIQDQAREKARKGEIEFRTFYRNCDESEAALVTEIGEELRALINEADKKERKADGPH
jgi:hypothetical protein